SCARKPCHGWRADQTHTANPAVVAQISRSYHTLGPTPLHLTGSKLAKPAVELPVVQAVHVVVPVEVEVPKVTGVTRVCLERGAKEVAILPIYVMVAVGVAEQPEERVDAIAAGRPVAVP